MENRRLSFLAEAGGPEGGDTFAVHTADFTACPDLRRFVIGPCAAFSWAVFRMGDRDQWIPAETAGSGPAAGESAAFLAALRTRSFSGAACGVRFPDLHRDAALGMTPGHY